MSHLLITDLLPHLLVQCISVLVLRHLPLETLVLLEQVQGVLIRFHDLRAVLQVRDLFLQLHIELLLPLLLVVLLQVQQVLLPLPYF